MPPSPASRCFPFSPDPFPGSDPLCGRAVRRLHLPGVWSQVWGQWGQPLNPPGAPAWGWGAAGLRGGGDVSSPPGPPIWARGVREERGFKEIRISRQEQQNASPGPKCPLLALGESPGLGSSVLSGARKPWGSAGPGRRSTGCSPAMLSQALQPPTRQICCAPRCWGRPGTPCPAARAR